MRSPPTLILLGLIVWLWFRPPAGVSAENRPAPPWQAPLADGPTLGGGTLKGEVVPINFGHAASVPPSFIVDADGRIRHKIAGQVHDPRLGTRALPLLAPLLAEAGQP